MKLSDTAFTSLKKIARRHLGLDIRSIGRAVFESALTKRMDELELDFTEYFTCITGSEFEQKIFVQGLLISESWFFREEHSITYALDTFKESRPIRVLSVPCARAEELISTLIYTHEKVIPYDQHSFEGYDLSESAIEQSRLFLYGNFSPS